MLIAYTNALELIRALRPVVDQLRLQSADAADQIERAATSIANNVAEGSRRTGKDQKRFYVIAHGSAAEVRATLQVAEAWGWKLDASAVWPILDRELGLLWGLTGSRSRRVSESPQKAQ